MKMPAILCKCTFVVLLSSCLMLSCNTPKSIVKDKVLYPETVLKLDPGPNNPRNGEGAFIDLKDGTILHVYTHYTGESGVDWGNAFLASRSSSDKGKTWSKIDKIEVPQEGDLNVMSVSLFRLDENTIGMLNLKVDEIFKCTPWMRISKDEGRTWGKPWKCITDREGYFGVNNDRIVELDNGRLLMPVVEHDVRNQQWDSIANRGIIWNFWSDDKGASWQSGDYVEYPLDIPDAIMHEPGVIPLKDGSIMMYNRTGSGSQFLSYSYDNGQSWTRAQPSHIKSPMSPAHIKRIPKTGDLLMVWNNNGIDQRRTPLSVGISKDEGKTWVNIKNIEDDPKGAFSYPAIHFVDDIVIVSYYANGLKSDYVKRFSLDWLYQ